MTLHPVRGAAGAGSVTHLVPDGKIHAYRVIGKSTPGAHPAPYLHDPRDPYRHAFPTLNARVWAGLGPRDCHPFTRGERTRANTTGHTLPRLRMGEALEDRAPRHLAQLWNADEHSTLGAYMVLLNLEAGKLERSAAQTQRGRA